MGGNNQKTEHGIDWDDDEDRWVERRTQFLSSGDVGLREKVAEAVAYGEIGYTSNGIAKKMDVTASTARNYLDAAEDAYPGITYRRVIDFDGDPEAGVEDIPDPPLSECPVCLKDRVHTTAVTKQMFPRWRQWGATEMLDDATHVCSYCHSVRIEGQWVRMETVAKRARNLGDSGSKSSGEYRDILTRGISTVSKATAVADTQERGERREVGDAEW